MKKSIKLQVHEAFQNDVNNGIVRIDTGFMHQIGVHPGDIVQLEGERRTVGIVDRAYPRDIGRNIIRIDGLLRRNARTGLGEFITISKAQVREAKKIVIAPARKGVLVRASPAVFKQGLLGRVVVSGDIVALGGAVRRRSTLSNNFEDLFRMVDEDILSFGFGDLKFVVAESNPKATSVIVTKETEVVFTSEPVSEGDQEQELEVNYEDIGGLREELKKIREMVELPLKHPEIFERLGIEAPKGVLLHGPPGTGKTLLAKAVANETNSHFILINGPEIMSKFYGQSEQNLRKKFEEADKNAPSIIFIDEIDAIATKREETQGEVERRVVAQLLALMDGLKERGRVVVIAASNVPNLLDPALRRPGRFDREIEIGVPSKEGRLDVLKIHTRNMPLQKSVNLKEVAAITHGFVGADLSHLAKEAAMTVLRRILPDLKLDEDQPIPKEVLEEMIIKRADFINALKIVRPSAMREVLVEVPNVKWNAVGGLEEVKQELKEAVEWPLKYPASFTRLGVTPPKGILLYGAPGTGKTLLAKAVATESEANFISIKGPELLSKWVGESQRAVRQVFRKARQTSPTVIFFDEIDALAPKRGASSDVGVNEQVVNQLLTEMDGLEPMYDVIIVAATNRPDIIDPALLRPGRFDRVILTPPPDVEGRLDIFKVHTASMPLEMDTIVTKKSTKVVEKKKNEDKTSIESKNKTEKIAKKKIDPVQNKARETLLRSLAQKTEGFAGADIASVCREAAILAMREDIAATVVTTKHFNDALKKVRPSITKEIVEAYAQQKELFSTAGSRQMMEEKPSYMG